MKEAARRAEGTAEERRRRAREGGGGEARFGARVAASLEGDAAGHCGAAGCTPGTVVWSSAPVSARGTDLGLSAPGRPVPAGQRLLGTRSALGPRMAAWGRGWGSRWGREARGLCSRGPLSPLPSTQGRRLPHPSALGARRLQRIGEGLRARCGQLSRAPLGRLLAGWGGGRGTCGNSRSGVQLTEVTVTLWRALRTPSGDRGPGTIFKDSAGASQCFEYLGRPGPSLSGAGVSHLKSCSRSE